MHRLQRCIRSALRQSCPNRAFSASAAASSSAAASAAQPALPAIQVLRLDHLRLPIRSQLRIEEALLRCKHPSVAGRSFFLLNQPPSSERSVVLGLSNKTELLVHMDEAERDGIQLVRRFSGGGTVFIDEQCWMATMIIHKHNSSVDGGAQSPSPPPPVLSPPLVHPSSLPAYPNTLMDWTRDFYSPVFGPDPAAAGAQAVSAGVSPSSSSSVPSFSLTGHDYCFASRKFGGNAQTITKDRWLHHTSFLWGLDSLPSISRYLQVPAKAPAYRAGRSHSDFLTSLREVWDEVEATREAAAALASASSGVDGAHDLRRFTRGNDPSTSLSSDLFRPASPSSVSPSSSSAVIPSALSSRVLWRLSHYFRLEYPSLDEIEAIVAQYAAEAKSSVKMLDYTEERQRAKQAAREAEEKQRAAAEAAAKPAAAPTETSTSS